MAFFTSSRKSDDSSPNTIRPLHPIAKIPSTVRFVTFNCMNTSSAVHRLYPQPHPPQFSSHKPIVPYGRTQAMMPLGYVLRIWLFSTQVRGPRIPV
jgi:hypothetical protein